MADLRRNTSRWSFALALVLVAFVRHATCDSRIQVYNTADCSGTSREFVGPNSGRCTTLLRSGNFSSFRVGHLDNGCAVTIYGEDTTSDICSGDQKVAVPFQNCYNNTFQYYSIDGCTDAAESSSVISSSSTADPSSTTVTSTGTDASQPTRVAPNTASSSDSSDGNSINVGAIAGGVVGGVAVGVIIATVAIVCFRRRRKAKVDRDEPPLYPGHEHELEISRKELGDGRSPRELHNEQVMEMQGSPVHEMPSRDSRAETGVAKSPADILKH